jgi:hypothetical protein
MGGLLVRGVRALQANQALVSPINALANAVLVGLMLLLAARQGQFVDIAAYTAGVSICAVAAVVLSGGSTLVYVTGNAQERRAVRRMRSRFTTPLLLLVSGCAAGVYAVTTELPWTAVLLGGVALWVNNRSELESGDLQRDQRVFTLATVLVSSRALGLVFLLLGSSYSAAMLTAAIATQVSLLAVRTTDAKASSTANDGSLTAVLRVGYRASLLGVSLTSVGIQRIPFIVAPLVASHGTAGAFATLLSAQQSVSVLITSGLYTLMAVRAKHSDDAPTVARVIKLERIFVAFAVLTSVPLAMLAGPAVRVLNVDQHDASYIWWLLLAAGLPLMVVNRALQYRLVAVRHSRHAFELLLAIVIGTMVSAALALATESLSWLAASFLIAEGCGLAIFMLSGRAAVLRQAGGDER